MIEPKHLPHGLTISNKPFCNVVVWKISTGLIAVHARWYTSEKSREQGARDLKKSWNRGHKVSIVRMKNDYETHCFKKALNLLK